MIARTRDVGGAMPLLLGLALGTMTTAGTTADAAALTSKFEYGTSGSVGGPGGDSSGPIAFQGLSSGSIALMPGSFSLGQFYVPAFPETGTLTYRDTPFHLVLNVSADGGLGGTVLIDGVLNGSITGLSASDMVASVTAVRSSWIGVLPFSLDQLRIDMPQVLAPGGINGGFTPVMAYVAGVPEPTTLAFCGLLAVGLGARRAARRWRARG